MLILLKLISKTTAALFFILLITATPTRAQTMSEVLETLDTGKFADAGCQAGLKTLVSFTKGLGTAPVSNFEVDKDVISGELNLSIGGFWNFFTLWVRDPNQ